MDPRKNDSGGNPGSGKILALNSTAQVRDRLVQAAGRLLAARGFERLTPDAVATEAGVGRRLLFHHFGGLERLVEDFSRSQDFWPSARELIGDDEAAIRAMSGAEQLAAFFKRTFAALLKRPQTLEILAWETLERNELTKVMEDVRVRTALEFFELLHDDIPDDIDLSAIVLVLAAAVSSIAVRSRVSRTWGGIDLQSETGWKRIEGAIELLLKGALAGSV